MSSVIFCQRPQFSLNKLPRFLLLRNMKQDPVILEILQKNNCLLLFFHLSDPEPFSNLLIYLRKHQISCDLLAYQRKAGAVIDCFCFFSQLQRNLFQHFFRTAASYNTKTGFFTAYTGPLYVIFFQNAKRFFDLYLPFHFQKGRIIPVLFKLKSDHSCRNRGPVKGKGTMFHFLFLSDLACQKLQKKLLILFQLILLSHPVSGIHMNLIFCLHNSHHYRKDNILKPRIVIQEKKRQRQLISQLKRFLRKIIKKPCLDGQGRTICLMHVLDQLQKRLLIVADGIACCN